MDVPITINYEHEHFLPPVLRTTGTLYVFTQCEKEAPTYQSLDMLSDHDTLQVARSEWYNQWAHGSELPDK